MTNSINYHIMENTTPKLGIIESDPWLEPYSAAIEGRHQHAIDKELELTNGKSTLSDFATGYLYFGLHRTKRGWVFREWAPNAKEIYIIGDFNGWKENGDYRMYRVKNSPGVWEVELNPNAVKHGDLYKLKVRWNGGEGERIPAWATRVVQDEQTKIFSAQVWAPEKPYKFRKKVFRAKIDPLMIYECHIGMAQNEEKVGTYNEFREKILPRVAADGYNCIQIMAIQEHPYYGSFGYHVSSFFAASSRFGTPDELKALIDAAVANAKFEVPEIMVEDRISQMVDEMRMSLESRKMTLEMYMQYTGMDMAKIRENQRATAAENVKTDLVLDAIAKAENIQVSMEDVDAELSAIAAQHGATLDEVKNIIKSNGNMGLLLANILRRKAAHVVIDNAK